MHVIAGGVQGLAPLRIRFFHIRFYSSLPFHGIRTDIPGSQGLLTYRPKPPVMLRAQRSRRKEIPVNHQIIYLIFYRKGFDNACHSRLPVQNTVCILLCKQALLHCS